MVIIHMFGYWLAMGILMAAMLFTCLMFARLCEKIVDFFTK